jgi:hypothetical protein
VPTVGAGIEMMALELPKLVGPKLVGPFCAKDAVEMTDRTASVDRAVFIVNDFMMRASGFAGWKNQ